MSEPSNKEETGFEIASNEETTSGFVTSNAVSLRTPPLFVISPPSPEMLDEIRKFAIGNE